MNNTFSDFLQKKGLYDSIMITEANFDELHDLIGGKVKISEYCVECGENRVFTMKPILFINDSDVDLAMVKDLSLELQRIELNRRLNTDFTLPKNENEWIWPGVLFDSATKVMKFSFTCSMDTNHHIDYMVRTEGNKMTKIGQYPSVADLSFPELKAFKKDISESDLKELRRAIGLHAQGIGVGSFVYLRRIFERILERTGQLAFGEDKEKIGAFANLHVKDKIKQLKDYLPETISENPVFYSIVSKGIHELSEDECIAFFPILKEFIMLILQQWEQKRKEQESQKRLKESLDEIVSKIS